MFISSVTSGLFISVANVFYDSRATSTFGASVAATGAAGVAE